MRWKPHQDLPGPASSAEILVGFYLDFLSIFGNYLSILIIHLGLGLVDSGRA